MGRKKAPTKKETPIDTEPDIVTPEKETPIDTEPDIVTPEKETPIDTEPDIVTPEKDTTSSTETPANETPSEEGTAIDAVFKSMETALDTPSVSGKHINEDRASIMMNLILTLALEAKRSEGNDLIKNIESNMTGDYADEFTTVAVGKAILGWGNDDHAREAFTGLTMCMTAIAEDTLEDTSPSVIRSQFKGEYNVLGEKLVSVYFA